MLEAERLTAGATRASQLDPDVDRPTPALRQLTLRDFQEAIKVGARRAALHRGTPRHARRPLQPELGRWEP